MLLPSIGLSGDFLRQLFPFHLIFNRALIVLQTGSGWRHGKVLLDPGTRVDKVFSCKRPASGWNFDRFRLDSRSVYVLQARESQFVLRGGMTYLPEHDALLYLASPWITQLSDLDQLQLRLSDFAAHDPLPDLLFLMQAQKSSLAELSLLTEQLTVAKEAAEGVVKLQNHFLANISHEIRTPLNGIIGMTDLALRTELNREQLHLLDTVKFSADSLVKVFDDILDFADIEAGRLTLEPVQFDIRGLVDTALRPIILLAQEKSLELTYQVDRDVPASAIGDPLRVSQILTHIAANAVKFTEQGGVSVHVKKGYSDGDHLRLELDLCDTGIGIAPDRLGSIFGAFTQADGSSSRKFGGTGLGLALSRRLAEAMNGSIAVESELGKGSKFSVAITLKHYREPQSQLFHTHSDHHAPQQPTTEQLSKRRALQILLAEDNPVNQQLMTKILIDDGHVVHVANNGLEAVSLFMEAHLDLVLMDIQMPVMGGYEATAEIRKRERPGVHTPIVAVTAHAMLGTREDCSRAGMDGYVAKPIRLVDLWSEIERVLEQHTG